MALNKLLDVVANTSDNRLPDVARACVAALGVQLRIIKCPNTGIRSPDHGLAPIQCGE